MLVRLSAEPHVAGRPFATSLNWRALAVVGGLLLLLAPLLVARIPPLIDYPNHLARMHVLATGADTPGLRAMFVIDWAFIPNMAMDIVVPALAQVMALDIAGKLFIGLAILLPPLGVVALHRAWFGRRSRWPWVGLLTGVNAFVILGLLNYDVGIGLALLGAAWHARRAVLRSPISLWVGMAGAALWGIACMLSHLAAFGLLVLLMISTETARWSRRDLLRRAAPILAASIVPLALYRALGPTATYASIDTLGTSMTQVLQHGLLSDLSRRATWSLAPFAAPWTILGLASAGLVLAAALWSAWRRQLAVAPQMLLALAALVVAYLMLPSQLAENGMMFERISLPLMLVAIAGIDPRLHGRMLVGFTVALAALVLVRSVGLAAVWSSQDRLVTDMERAIEPIEPGARVLVVRDGTNPWHIDPDETGARRALLRSVSYGHLGALVTLDRDAFYPMIFSIAGKQPVRLRPAYEAQAQSDGYVPLTTELAPAASVPASPGRCKFNPNVLPCQLWSWPQRYDYVLRLNAHGPALEDGRLTQVAASGWAVLYRVHRL